MAPGAAVYDVSNACLGVLNGMVDIANRIELGQIRAGNGAAIRDEVAAWGVAHAGDA